MRGEQSWWGDEVTPAQGSPPLARGTVSFFFESTKLGGITPACAGNRATALAAAWAEEDHPRLRGEQMTGEYAAFVEKGSPPLARGTAGHAAAVQRLVGITPACAGNSPFACALFGAFKDHPRLRGEQRPTRRIDGFMAGSPPLARGTAFTTDEIIMLSGITPACAGNSCTNVQLYGMG